MECKWQRCHNEGVVRFTETDGKESFWCSTARDRNGLTHEEWKFRNIADEITAHFKAVSDLTDVLASATTVKK